MERPDTISTPVPQMPIAIVCTSRPPIPRLGSGHREGSAERGLSGSYSKCTHFSGVLALPGLVYERRRRTQSESRDRVTRQQIFERVGIVRSSSPLTPCSRAVDLTYGQEARASPRP